MTKLIIRRLSNLFSVKGGLLSPGLFNRALPVVLFIIPFIVLSVVLKHNFQDQWDDWWVVKNKYTEGGVNLKNIIKILSEFYRGQYAPVNELFYLIIYSIFGYNPFWFHLFCLLIHCLNVLLVFYNLRLFLSFFKINRDNSRARIAALTALIFSVHPFLVEAIAWISASKIIIYAFFYLLAIYFYLLYLKEGQRKYFFYVVLLFFLSYGAKEQAVMLPVCLLLIDYYCRPEPFSSKVLLEKIPLFIISFAFGLIALFSQKVISTGFLSDQPTYALHHRLIFFCYSITEYFTKCLFPIKLSFLYPFLMGKAEQLPIKFYIYPIFIIGSLLFLWKYSINKLVSFGLLFFLVHIIVVSHIVPLSRYAIVSDRYVYVSSIGVFLIIAYFINELWLKKPFNIKLILFASLYFIYLAAYTHNRAKVWKNTDTLKQEIRQYLKEKFSIRPTYNSLPNQFW